LEFKSRRPHQHASHELDAMVKKKSDEQRSRDECVRTIAGELKREEWNVKADVEGEEKPSRIGTFTPDIEATKGCLRRICQVVTEKDFKGNKQAYIEFKNYCDEYDFHFYVVDKDGKRREIDPKKLGKE
jgi:hypothetical protein